MPKYDFRCSQCGQTFELRRPVSEATDPAFCPNDNAPAERVFSTPLVFGKGDSTFYVPAGDRKGGGSEPFPAVTKSPSGTSAPSQE